ncbi:MAG: porin [Candidatus Krumholzibacteriota bacterium]|nr:porin [Candidatus Krumholzibacteriota bacterium]
MVKRILVFTLLLAVVSISNAAGSDIEAKIYGKIHLSLESLGDGDNSSIYLSSNTSRIGFKGSLDLEKDLVFFWQIENQVNFDETGNEFASRSTFAGISGNFGKVLFGRDDTPFKKINRKIDLFSEQIGDSRNIAGVGGYGFNLRVNNAIEYQTKDLCGIFGSVLYVPEEGEDDASLLSASLSYDKACVFAAIAYEQHGSALTEFDDRTENGLRLAGGYSRDKYRVVCSFETLSNIDGVRDAARSTFGFGGSFKAHEKLVLKAQYHRTPGISIDGDSVDDTDASLISAGIDYPAGENTKFYAAYSVARNENNADYTFVGGGHGETVTPDPGDNPSGVSFGFIHLF